MQSRVLDVCRLVAEATALEEGPSGVEAILRCIHRCQPVSPKEVARQVGFPVPLVSAVRRELEREGWLIRRNGMVLSEKAHRATDALWGAVSRGANGEEERDLQRSDEEASRLPALAAASLHPLDEEEDTFQDEEPGMEDYIPLQTIGGSGASGDDPFLEFLEELFEERPPADPKWDQSHATLDTTLRRATLFLEKGYVQGKRSLFLGDDDLSALVTLSLVQKQLGEEALASCMTVVVEIDPRLVEFIRDSAVSEGLPLAVVEHDLRDPLPKALVGAFDFFFTDPPYTEEGVGLFLDRGGEALGPDSPRKGVLAVPLSPPSLQAATQKSLLSKGFLIDFLEPFFNSYDGATMQGGVSALYGLSLVRRPRAKGRRYEGRLYTAQTKGRKTDRSP